MLPFLNELNDAVHDGYFGPNPTIDYSLKHG